MVARGTVTTGPERDHTVKVDVGGLEPATTYWYRFSAGDDVSPVGRTRTAPAPGRRRRRPPPGPGLLRLLRRRLVPRLPQPGPARRRPRRPRGRLPLRERPPLRRRPPPPPAGHGRSAWPATGPATPCTRPTPTCRPSTPATPWRRCGTTTSWPAGRGRAVPTSTSPPPRSVGGAQGGRASRPTGSGCRCAAPTRPTPALIYRMLRWGDLADLAMLDTRLVGRDKPVGRGRGVVVRAVRPGPVDPGRRPAAVAGGGDGGLDGPMAAARQPGDAGALAAGGGPLLLNPGQWDGYPRERDWLYGVLAAAGRAARHVVVLSGDIHSSWANDLPVGAEFVAPSVSSPSLRRHPGAGRAAGGRRRRSGCSGGRTATSGWSSCATTATWWSTSPPSGSRPTGGTSTGSSGRLRPSRSAGGGSCAGAGPAWCRADRRPAGRPPIAASSLRTGACRGG